MPSEDVQRRHVVTCAGSPFQTRAGETGNARSPTVQRRVGGTTSATQARLITAATEYFSRFQRSIRYRHFSGPCWVLRATKQ